MILFNLCKSQYFSKSTKILMTSRFSLPPHIHEVMMDVQSFSTLSTKTKRKVRSLRLERIISNRGVGSRSQVAKLLKQGQVTIEGQIIRSGSARYPEDIEIEVNGKIVTHTPLLALYNKPIGTLSTIGDPIDRMNLKSLYDSYDILRKMHPVGRLDADTSGLLLFSSNGPLTQRLLHPSCNVEREYEAIVLGQVDKETLTKKLSDGVGTTIGKFCGKLEFAEPYVHVLDEAVIQNFLSKYRNQSIEAEESGGDSSNASASAALEEEHHGQLDHVNEIPIDPVVPRLNNGNNIMEQLKTLSIVRMTVQEGKYRMVRRMLHNVGHSVVHLNRIRYGKIKLQDLAPGTIRICDDSEAMWAESLLTDKNISIPVPKK